MRTVVKYCSKHLAGRHVSIKCYCTMFANFLINIVKYTLSLLKYNNYLCIRRRILLICN